MSTACSAGWTEALDTERSLAANAAHELRTPLAAVRLRLQTALDQDLARTDVQAALDALPPSATAPTSCCSFRAPNRRTRWPASRSTWCSSRATVAEEFWARRRRGGGSTCEIAENGVRRRAATSIRWRSRCATWSRTRCATAATRRSRSRSSAPCALLVRDDGPGVAAATLEPCAAPRAPHPGRHRLRPRPVDRRHHRRQARRPPRAQLAAAGRSPGLRGPGHAASGGAVMDDPEAPCAVTNPRRGRTLRPKPRKSRHRPAFLGVSAADPSVTLRLRALLSARGPEGSRIS